MSRLSSLVTRLSLLLCLASVAMWVRSYWRMDGVERRALRLHKVVSGGGGVVLERVERVTRTGDPRTGMDAQHVHLATYVDSREPYNFQTDGGVELPLWRWESGYYVNPLSMAIEAGVWTEDALLPRVERVESNSGYSGGGTIVMENWEIGRALWLPWWVPTALFAALPASRLPRFILRRR